MSEPASPASVRRRRWVWVLAILAALALLIGLPWWLWARSADAALRAEVEAIRARGEPLEWKDFASPPLPDDQNAAELYLQAAAVMERGGNPPADPREIARAKRLTDMLADLVGHRDFRRQHAEEVREVLRLSADALGLCRKARALSQSDWKLNFSGPAIFVAIPSLGRHRELCRRLCLAALRAHETGDDAAAVEYLRDALALGRSTGCVPTLVSHLVHLACDGLVVFAIEEIAPSLRVGGAAPAARPADVRALLDDLLDEAPLREGQVLGFLAERCFTYDTFEGLRRGTLNIAPMVPDCSPARLRLIPAPVMKLDEVRALRHMGGYVAAARADNYPQAEALLPAFTPPRTIVEKLTRIVSTALRPTLSQVVKLHFHGVASRRMAATALAMRLYEIDTGRPPGRLPDLVPKYLPVVPEDPFSGSGQRIGYLPDGTPPLLYSVGSDGKDDAGAYAKDRDGSVDWEQLDLPFFLNGQRPLGKPRWEDPRILSLMGCERSPPSPPLPLGPPSLPVPWPPGLLLPLPEHLWASAWDLGPPPGAGLPPPPPTPPTPPSAPAPPGRPPTPAAAPPPPL